MILAKLWDGTSLKGDWQFTIKIDGVRAIRTSDGWVSRRGKPLYNIPDIDSPSNDFEVFDGSFKATMEKVKSKRDLIIHPSSMYSLDPLDERLMLANVLAPSADYIKRCLAAARSHGHEGLVLRQKDIWLKVKPEETYDVKITGFIEGTGRNKGRLGAVMTERGKVGVGFSDHDRNTIWQLREKLIDSTIEVSCMQLTEAGKFRHARFVRLRPDK